MLSASRQSRHVYFALSSPSSLDSSALCLVLKGRIAFRALAEQALPLCPLPRPDARRWHSEESRYGEQVLVGVARSRRQLSLHLPDECHHHYLPGLLTW